ncbi:unnamed protein product [Caenorhabditis sp. 36 PRJEB53466]|nr:unnamed protein product [Caenorhabditis sp. 36 PRJEB53466]
MSIISNFYFCQYFEVVVGKLLMITWQYGYSPIPGVPKSTHYLGWANENQPMMPKIRRFDDALPLFLGSFLIWHYMMQMVFFIFFYCLERVIATVLLGTYEKHSRSYIAISILIAANLTTLTVTYLLFFLHISFVSSVLICSTPVTYVLQLARKVIIWIGIYIVLNISLLFLINLDRLPAHANLVLVFVVENCIYLNPLLVCSVTVTAVEPWRSVVERDFQVFTSFFGATNKVEDSERIAEEKSGAAQPAQLETDIYFRDLNAMWA